MEQSEAEQKFLNIPELIERLMSFLDIESALHLTQSQVVDKQTLQKAFSSKGWDKLIRQSSLGERGLASVAGTTP